MTLYDLMADYARTNRIPPDAESLAPELGRSLGLFHSSLVEGELPKDETPGGPRITVGPDQIECTHISHFIVAFLPFNGVTEKNEINSVLFEVYSFFRWLEKKNIPHGLAGLDLMQLMKDLSSMQERCLKLSHLLDDESGRVLDNSPDIVNTVNDVFSVVNIEKDTLSLKGSRQEDVLQLRLPTHILSHVHMHDHLDLVLGDTLDRWVILEAGQVYPEYTPKTTSS